MILTTILTDTFLQKNSPKTTKIKPDASFILSRLLQNTEKGTCKLDAKDAISVFICFICSLSNLFDCSNAIIPTKNCIINANKEYLISSPKLLYYIDRPQKSYNFVYPSLAQSIKHLTVNQRVVGSSLTREPNKKSEPLPIGECFGFLYGIV